jgi:hypothetical protein
MERMEPRKQLVCPLSIQQCTRRALSCRGARAIRSTCYYMATTVRIEATGSVLEVFILHSARCLVAASARSSSTRQTTRTQAEECIVLGPYAGVHMATYLCKVDP